MNGAETQAGGVFVEMVRQRAENVAKHTKPWEDMPVSHALAAIATVNGRPPAVAPVNGEKPPHEQYAPFRRTFLEDPKGNPSLQYACVGENHAYTCHETEVSKHWQRAGSSWSRVPRFQKGQSAWDHDPAKPKPVAITDGYYNTEISTGLKQTMYHAAMRSRWQACHSAARTRSPREASGKQDWSPGPTDYSPFANNGPWTPAPVCGAVPMSPMFQSPSKPPKLRPHKPDLGLGLGQRRKQKQGESCSKSKGHARANTKGPRQANREAMKKGKLKDKGATTAGLSLARPPTRLIMLAGEQRPRCLAVNAGPGASAACVNDIISTAVSSSCSQTVSADLPSFIQGDQANISLVCGMRTAQPKVVAVRKGYMPPPVLKRETLQCYASEGNQVIEEAQRDIPQQWPREVKAFVKGEKVDIPSRLQATCSGNINIISGGDLSAFTEVRAPLCPGSLLRDSSTRSIGKHSHGLGSCSPPGGGENLSRPNSHSSDLNVW
ncbi:unnamed protein product [Chrysoparadoxa australica]